MGQHLCITLENITHEIMHGCICVNMHRCQSEYQIKLSSGTKSKQKSIALKKLGVSRTITAS